MARPIDDHTVYVAADLVSEACLTRCDFNQDGRIQYQLWPGTETVDRTEDAEPPDESKPEELPDAEYNCWQQCKTGGVASVVAPLPAGASSAGKAAMPAKSGDVMSGDAKSDNTEAMDKDAAAMSEAPEK